MSSSINAAYPQQGTASTANVRSNFASAVSEIEALQNATGVGGGSGGTIDIDAGTIDGVTIGGASAGAGTFTTLVGTTIDGPVGSVTPAAGTFTTLTGTTVDGIVGSVTPAAGTFTTLATTGAVTFNDAGADVDFRVESTGSANMLAVDAGNDHLLVGGNVGIGVTPESDWDAAFTALQLGGIGALWGTTNQAAAAATHLANNVYYDGSNFKYIVTDEAVDVSFVGGSMIVNGAASGTADTNITLVEALRTLADGGVKMPNLPTADPVNAGELWNDSGTLKVSAG